MASSWASSSARRRPMTSDSGGNFGMLSSYHQQYRPSRTSHRPPVLDPEGSRARRLRSNDTCALRARLRSRAESAALPPLTRCGASLSVAVRNWSATMSNARCMMIVLPLTEEVDQDAELEARRHDAEDDRHAQVAAGLSMVFFRHST